VGKNLVSVHQCCSVKGPQHNLRSECVHNPGSYGHTCPSGVSRTRLRLRWKHGAVSSGWQCHDSASLGTHSVMGPSRLWHTRGPCPDSLSHVGYSGEGHATLAAKCLGGGATALSAHGLAVSTDATLWAHYGWPARDSGGPQNGAYNYATRLSPECLSHNALRTEHISSGECVYKPSYDPFGFQAFVGSPRPGSPPHRSSCRQSSFYFTAPKSFPFCLLLLRTRCALCRDDAPQRGLERPALVNRADRACPSFSFLASTLGLPKTAVG